MNHATQSSGYWRKVPDTVSIVALLTCISQAISVLVFLSCQFISWRSQNHIPAKNPKGRLFMGTDSACSTPRYHWDWIGPPGRKGVECRGGGSPQNKYQPSHSGSERNTGQHLKVEPHITSSYSRLVDPGAVCPGGQGMLGSALWAWACHRGLLQIAFAAYFDGYVFTFMHFQTQ